MNPNLNVKGFNTDEQSRRNQESGGSRPIEDQ
jgi:hypothetical protein